ncbi:class I SAM-dependent DNA methyltransferase [Streptomyces griseoviridis]
MSADTPGDPDFIDRTRHAYDAMAEEYAARFPDDALDDLPVDRALLHAFVELVRAAGPAPVADVGSGPGHLTARLDALRVPVFGVDLSPRTVALARRTHPGLRFHVGSMTALDLPDATVGGIVALYSLIHIPDGRLTAVLAEFHRVLVPGGQVLLGFQSGSADGTTERLHLAERFGHPMDLDYHFRAPETVVGHLTKAGLRLSARVVREALDGESRPRAYLLAHKAV